MTTVLLEYVIAIERFYRDDRDRTFLESRVFQPARRNPARRIAARFSRRERPPGDTVQ